MADVFGRQLLSNVEVLGFAELLHGIRQQSDHLSRGWFNCAQIDDIVALVSSSNPSSASAAPPPLIELTSVGPGGGKTHLLYTLASLAVLPSKHGGRDGCVVIIDADGTFRASRLAQQMKHRLRDWSSTTDETTLHDIVQHALQHVYIYRPQTMRGMVEDITGVADRLIHQEHVSRDKGMSFIAIDSASAFQWQVRAEEEHAAFLTSLAQSSGASTTSTEPLIPVTFTDLRHAIETCSKAFQCPVLYTSRYPGKTTSSRSSTGCGSLSKALHPALPAPMSSLATLRLILRRMPVRKIPQGLGLDELLREQAERIKVVSRARFECAVDESCLNLQQLQRLRASSVHGFHFCVKAEGLTMETKQTTESEDVA